MPFTPICDHLLGDVSVAHSGTLNPEALADKMESLYNSIQRLTGWLDFRFDFYSGRKHFGECGRSVILH